MKIFAAALGILLSTNAFAGQGGDPNFDGLTVTGSWDRGLMTHYSATPDDGDECRYEGGVGGPDTSPSGIRPLRHTIDDALKGKHMEPIRHRQAVMAAVPQEGGTHKLFGCFFSLPEAYPGILFFAGDTYGEDSNGKIKVDISSKCTQRVNTTKHSKILVYNCKGVGHHHNLDELDDRDE